MVQEDRLSVSRSGKLYQDYNWFYTHYIELKMSMGELAKLCKCSKDTIWDWRKRHGIKLRRRECTGETRKKISLAKKGQVFSVAWREKHSKDIKAAHIRGCYKNHSEAIRAAYERGCYDTMDHTCSEETREKKRQAMLGKYHTEEAKKKMGKAVSAAHARGAYGDECRKKISESVRELWVDPGYREQFEEMWNSEEWRSRVSKRIKAAYARGAYSSDETKKKRSDTTKAAWDRGCYENAVTDETRAKLSEAITAAHVRGCYPGRVSPSSLERLMYSACEELGIKYIDEYKIPGDSRYYDLFLPEYTLLIEIQGSYWHTQDWIAKRDVAKCLFAWDSDYRFAAVWEDEINENANLSLSNAIIGVL